MTLRFRVDKLIRDKLPAIMRSQGLTVFTRRLDDAEFVNRLKDKLIEEAGEAQRAGDRAELIARFGHNLALNWNLGEEINSASLAQKVEGRGRVRPLVP